MPTVGVVLVSDSRSAGRAVDASITIIVRFIADSGFKVGSTTTVPDRREQISDAIVGLVDSGHQLVITSGGTGLSPTDITPEATADVCDREVPGVAELLRSKTARYSERAWLSRGYCGMRGSTLVVNLPGSPRAVEQCLAELAPILGHACEVAAGRDSHRGE